MQNALQQLLLLHHPWSQLRGADITMIATAVFNMLMQYGLKHTPTHSCEITHSTHIPTHADYTRRPWCHPVTSDSPTSCLCQVSHDDAMASPNDVTNASAVISARLVTFRSIEELAAQNTQLLAVTRDLGAQLERTREEARRELQLQAEAEQAAMRAETEELRVVCERMKEELSGYQQRVQRDSDVAAAARSKASPAGKDQGARGAAVQRELEEVRQKLAEAEKQLGEVSGVQGLYHHQREREGTRIAALCCWVCVD